MERKCPFCNKRTVEDNFYIDRLGFKISSLDLGTVRVNTYNVFKVPCCQVCYKHEKMLNRLWKYSKWISLVFIVLSLALIVNFGKMSIIGIKIESLAVILLGLAVIIFALGYITNRFRDVFLKILSNICLKQNYYGIIRFLQK